MKVAVIGTGISGLTLARDLHADHEITVFDALGRRLNTVADATYAPGRYAVRLDARGWASGVYFCHLQVDDFETTRQVVVLR